MRVPTLAGLLVLFAACVPMTAPPADEASPTDATFDAHDDADAQDSALADHAVADATEAHDAPTADHASRDAATDTATPHDAATDAMPALPVPASLLHALAATPYVEVHCTPTTYAGWPYAAQSCTYSSGYQVTVADPSAMRVGLWIVDAAEHIDAVAALRTRDASHYEAALVRMAQHTMGQSSRIFPLHGQVEEDVPYDFRDGVTYGYPGHTRACNACSCRVNSTTRPQWCAYQAGTHGASNAACLTGYGGTSGWNDAWAAHCLANEIDAWNSTSNAHYVAQAWVANEDLRTRFPHPGSARGSDVVAALGEHYPIP